MAISVAHVSHYGMHGVARFHSGRPTPLILSSATAIGFLQVYLIVAVE